MHIPLTRYSVESSFVILRHIPFSLSFTSRVNDSILQKLELVVLELVAQIVNFAGIEGTTGIEQAYLHVSVYMCITNQY